MTYPSKYSDELALEICARMANGETLNQICKDAHIPARSTVVGWARDNLNGFAAPYARARDLLLDHIADEILDISDDSRNDFIIRETEKGRTERIVDQENIARDRLRVDSRKWLLSKLRPDRYGEKTSINISAGPPPSTEPESKTLSWLEEVLGGEAVASKRAALPAPDERTKPEIETCRE
jgi:hypothetical protein